MGDGTHGAESGETVEGVPREVWERRLFAGLYERPAYELGQVVIERPLTEEELQWMKTRETFSLACGTQSS
jgi:hypothetical protein